MCASGLSCVSVLLCISGVYLWYICVRIHVCISMVSCPSELVFPPRFLKIVVVVKASGLPHVVKLWLRVSKGLLAVRYFCSNKKPPFVSVECHGDHMTIIELR